MSAISNIHAREVLDSRGNPTIQVEVTTELGGYGSAMVPSGASTGILEANELRDGSVKGASKALKDAWFGGKGVMTAVNNVNNKITPSLVGIEVTEQRLIDMTMIKLDGTKNKSKLGANAILGVSLAVLKAAADELDLPLYKYIGGTNARKLPVPMLNVINGGEHASNTIDFQEFMIMPVGATTLKEALQMANKTFHTLAKLLKKAGHGTQVGDEGGFAPNLKSHEEALEFLVEAIKEAGYKPATKGTGAIAIAMDPASSELYDEKTGIYTFGKLKAAIESKQKGFTSAAMNKTKVEFTTEEMVDYLGKLVKKFPIISIEDGLAETDWAGFEAMNSKMGNKLQVMGDDLFVTNAAILKKGIKANSANSILIKLNQIGSVSETMDTIELAHKAGFTCVVSHRSGETEDTTIADLAVGLNTGQIKTGSMSRSDRIAKYNRLLAIEEQLGVTAEFDGEKTFHNLKRNV
ncbi:phosphopyruvate hydratase [Mycoplasma marinum]|uniref:Enolase n=1 Tax=Mycoplasma marinum TaxID=1937190 RepID=A0A4R0XJ98_9MOLU|nr:phosphopyruvate hydratase [Mycoplasma marinum]TCG10706.1 phosphopyruvate hydratase [Mycoplasma marinum]